MNILIIPSWYPTSENPMSGTFFREQALALQNNGHAVSVMHIELVSIKKIFKKNCIEIKHYNDKGLDTFVYKISIFGLTRLKRIREFILKTITISIFKKINQKNKVDVIHVHHYQAVEIGNFIKKMYSIPIVMTEHYSGIARRLLTNEEKLLLKQAVGCCDDIICVGNKLKDELLNVVGYRNVKVIPNIVSNAFKISYKKKTSNSFVFFSAGNLIEVKNMDLLIKCFISEFGHDEPVKLLIAGKGSDYDCLNLLIQEAGRSDQIELLGAKTRLEMIELMQECESFVLLSKLETFGVVYVEALASGKPVIATNNGGANDIITEKDGLLVEEKDPQSISAAMRYMYLNSSAYNPIDIAERCQNRFGERPVVSQIEEVYKRVLYEVKNEK